MPHAVRRDRAGRHRGRRGVLRARDDDVVQRHRSGVESRGEPDRARQRARVSTGDALYNDRIVNTFDDGFVVAVHVQRRRATTAPTSRCRRAWWPRSTTARSSSCSSTSTRASSRERVRDPRAVRGVLRRVPEPPRRRARPSLRRRLHHLAQRLRPRDNTRREPGALPRGLCRPAPAHLQRPHRQHLRRRLRHPVHAQRRHAHRPPRRAVDLHRRALPRREDHAHRRVHGFVEVRGVDREDAR